MRKLAEDPYLLDGFPPYAINVYLTGDVLVDAASRHAVAGFKVLDVPGHSAGHVAYWREADRTLICGDVFTNIDTITGIPDCTSRGRSSPRTQRATGSRGGGWRSSSRRWCALAAAGHCPIPPG